MKKSEHETGSKKEMIKKIKQMVNDLPSSDSDKSVERKKKGEEIKANYDKLHTELCEKYPQFHSFRIHCMLKPMYGKVGWNAKPEQIREKFEKKANKKLAKFSLDSNETELLNKLKVIFTEKDKTEFFLMRMVRKFGKLSFDQLCEKVNSYHKLKEDAAKDPSKKKEFESL